MIYYDSLTAQNRPYKRAVSWNKTLRILNVKAEKGMLGKKLVAIFVKKEIYSALQEE
ncbi:hypothetical protein [Flexistipes sp.]|uniref:hypothetical protein n=1 Tax=Flexistipes sp. TaxID=3088135 RepID=UPI002E205AF0|nr:hypothetical protein [Flexistipes sp.]